MDLWQQFWSSGKVDDYLEYIRQQSQTNDDVEVHNADNDKGYYNQRTDYWGE